MVIFEWQWQVNDYSHRNLLAIPVGIEQKHNVDAIVQKVIQFFVFNIQNSIIVMYVA